MRRVIQCCSFQSCGFSSDTSVSIHDKINMQGPVVRKVDSAIHRIVNFSTAVKRHERQWP